MFHPVGTVCHKGGHEALLAHGLSRADTRGMANLLLIIFVATNCREIMANILKYGEECLFLAGDHDNVFNDKGILVRWIPSTKMVLENQSMFAAVLMIFGIAEIAFRLERHRASAFEGSSWPENVKKDKPSHLNPETETNTPKQSRRKHQSTAPDESAVEKELAERKSIQFRGERVFSVAVSLWALTMMLAPYFLVSNSSMGPALSLGVLMLSVAWFLKLASYHHVLHDVRTLILNGQDLESVCSYSNERIECAKFPDNLTRTSFWLYMAYPTLCFQFHYPRKSSTHWLVVAKSLSLIGLCGIGMKILVEQYMTVIVQNTFVVMYGKDHTILRLLGHFFERMLKLSLPTLYLWLLMFVSFFHFWLVVLAELTRFDDKQFYDDWWNATGFGEYWRKWNLPVHNFCARHIYKPLLKRGVPKFIAGQIVFIVSALAHEYLVVAPLKMGWTGLVFTAFVLQTPLAIITDAQLSTRHPTWGNILFWIVFCFTGQPVRLCSPPLIVYQLAVMVFYYLWNVGQGTFRAVTAQSMMSLTLV